MVTIKKYSEDETVLGGDIVDRVWYMWYADNVHQNPFFIPSYTATRYRNTAEDRFNTWVFVQGGRIVRENKKYCIKFDNSNDALAFRMKYG